MCGDEPRDHDALLFSGEPWWRRRAERQRAWGFSWHPRRAPSDAEVSIEKVGHETACIFFSLGKGIESVSYGPRWR